MSGERPAGPPRTVFFGSGTFGFPALDSLARSPDVELVAVVTAPARPAGRRRDPLRTPIARAAAELGVAVLEPPRLRARDAVEAVLALEPRLAVLADYGQLVPAPILELELGALNLHPSLLPRHRGATPIPAAILAGDAETGVTLFRMNEGLDTGPIIAAESVTLAGDETAPDLEQHLAQVAAALLGRALGPWVRGEIRAVPQDETGATLTRPLRREDGRLDPRRPARDLERHVRALQPWPGSFLEAGGMRLAVWRTAVLPTDPAVRPAVLVAAGDGLALTTADGAIELLEVQPAGGRRMTGAELRRGRPQLVGAPV